MNEQFKLKDICIGQHLHPKSKYNGAECEIIGGLEMRGFLRVHTGEYDEAVCYKVQWADGYVTSQYPHQLRRKPPKQSDKEWAEGKVREITQESVHVASGKPELIPEETA